MRGRSSGWEVLRRSSQGEGTLRGMWLRDLREGLPEQGRVDLRLEGLAGAS